METSMRNTLRSSRRKSRGRGKKSRKSKHSRKHKSKKHSRKHKSKKHSRKHKSKKHSRKHNKDSNKSSEMNNNDLGMGVISRVELEASEKKGMDIESHESELSQVGDTMEGGARVLC